MNLYCLTNFIDYSLSIHQPLKHSNRIKYTCFDISDNYIVLGATSGSLYLFNRRGKFLHLIPSKHGSVNQLSISANEKFVGFSTQRSVVCVYAINLSAQALPQVIFTNLCSDQSVQVTCLHWTQDEKQFYYGDSKGQVNLVLLSTFMGSGINMSIHPILFLESSIVQIDHFESLLLVSNCSKCILCNTEYEEYKQIGNKPRDGAYGACFSISSNEAQNPSRIFCARPGSRIWEVDFEGDVIQTHQFKFSLACPPSKIQKEQSNGNDNDNDNFLTDNDGNDEMLDYQPQNLQFAKMLKLTQEFLLTYTELGIYIFDVRTSSVVLWCNQFERIIDCKVCNDEIIVFTQTGSLYSLQLHSLQSQASALVRNGKLLECARLMRKNVRYFADKAREDYELSKLNHIKIFLMNRHQYELLNDLSVIFDAISQCESNGDNHSSGGSSSTADRGCLLEATTGQSQNSSAENSQGVYVLENSFCESLKPQKGEKHFKDALLTVTGKFGKNIIKYKFNIFAEEQKKLVRDLIPANERSLPFKDIKAIYENDEEIVCCTKKYSSTSINHHSTSKSGSKFFHGISSEYITAEEKTIYNLYLICKSSKFSNTNFVERYRSLFDEYSAPELIQLLEKLFQLMIEQGDDPKHSRRHCYKMYFHYLNPELIWEMDDSSRDYITRGFVLLNSSEDIVRCDNCMFPLRFDNSCSFHELGSVLLRYYWSRNEQVKCFDVLTRVPALFDVLAKLYLAEYNMDKVLPIVLNYGQTELLMDIGKSFSLHSWSKCFEQFVDLQQGRLTCVNCECVTTVENVNRHFFYTWNCFLSVILECMQTEHILSLILKWSNSIPNDAIDREFYSRCLLEG